VGARRVDLAALAAQLLCAVRDLYVWRGARTLAPWGADRAGPAHARLPPTPTPPAADGVNNSFTLFLADEAGVPLPRASLFTSLYAGLRPRTRHEQRRSSLA
jgi:hypothetical protein